MGATLTAEFLAEALDLENATVAPTK